MGSCCSNKSDYEPIDDENFLGEGTFGRVVKVNKNDRDYAVKIIRKNIGNVDIHREIDLLQRVKGHPHIVNIYDVDYSDRESLRIYMEYCDEGNMVDFLKRHEILLEEMLVFFKQLVEAVAYIHSQGVIHRDIKPTNILIKTENGRYVTKLADFGVGNVARTMGWFKTCVGSLQYMAPEVRTGNNEVHYTFSADIYSLGVVFRKIAELYQKSDKQKSVINMANKMAADNPKKRMILAEVKRKLEKRLEGSMKQPEPRQMKQFTC